MQNSDTLTTAQAVKGTLSVVVITKNEERNIAACLDSVDWADELVVVDACSADRTVELAKQYHSKTFIRPWPGYGPQKNFGMAQATKDWILILDADERVSSQLKSAIETVLTSEAKPVAYRIPRKNYYYGRWIQGAGQYPDPQLRLLRRGAGKYNDLPVHEHLEVQGPISDLDGHLDHHAHPTVAAHAAKIQRYSALAAQEKIQAGRRKVFWWNFVANPLWAFIKVYLIRRGYRDGLPGLLVSGFAAAHVLLKYIRLWK